MRWFSSWLYFETNTTPIIKSCYIARQYCFDYFYSWKGKGRLNKTTPQNTSECTIAVLSCIDFYQFGALATRKGGNNYILSKKLEICWRELHYYINLREDTRSVDRCCHMVKLCILFFAIESCFRSSATALSVSFVARLLRSLSQFDSSELLAAVAVDLAHSSGGAAPVYVDERVSDQQLDIHPKLIYYYNILLGSY